VFRKGKKKKKLRREPHCSLSKGEKTINTVVKEEKKEGEKMIRKKRA